MVKTQRAGRATGMSTETVAAVVVTFNRKQLLTECLDALLAQTRPVNRIFIIDNASSDGTPELLTERGYLGCEWITYKRLTENLGGAGGFHEGMKQAYDLGYDWVWVMDDDAEPALDALQILAEEFVDPKALAVAGVVVDSDGLPSLWHRGWVNRETVSFSARQEITEADLNDDHDITFATFVGLCVSRKAIDLVGFPMRDFFIHHDDLEFCDRISRISPFKLKVRSIIRHKEAARRPDLRSRFLWFYSDRISYQKLWISYYGLRNTTWRAKRDFGAARVLLFCFRYFLTKAVGILAFDDHKLKRLFFVFSALYDGWNGIFLNTKPKTILYG